MTDTGDQYEYEPDEPSAAPSEPNEGHTRVPVLHGYNPGITDTTGVADDCSDDRDRWRAMPGKQRLSRWLQYLYFSRFCVLAYVALPLLCWLDGCTGVSSVTRGILTLGRQWQAFHTAFFVTALTITALVCLRNIVRNGQERFGVEPPLPLRCRLQSVQPRDMLGALLLALLPAAVTLGYVAATTLHEQRIQLTGTASTVVGFGAYAWRLWVGYGLGLLFAFAFWYFVSVVYFWTYPASRPAALIFPPGLPGFHWAEGQHQPRMAVWLEDAARVALRWTHEGYASGPGKPPWELHSFSAVALATFFVLYLLLYPLLAPVNIGRGSLDGAIAGALELLFLVGASSAPSKETPNGSSNKPANASGAAARSMLQRFRRFCRSCLVLEPVARAFLACTAVLLALFLCLVVHDGIGNTVLLETAFPALASLLVILIFGLWLMSGLSFLLDRYRVPVMTLVLLLIVGAKWIPVDQEHYFATVPTTALGTGDLLTPRTVVDHQQTPDGEPMIVVTASGGGIQAAEWTAEVMAELEHRFASDPDLRHRGYAFHDHVLLLSGVSGGSVGLMPFLLEYTAARDDRFSTRQRHFSTGDPRAGTGVDALHDRLTLAPGCSSLEAVAWGLEYYDLQRLLLTLRIPWLQSTADGDAPDRTWALSRALDRNLDNVDCGTDGLLTPSSRPGTTASGLPGILSGRNLTLKQSALRLRDRSMPAFTFNTTVAETGGRFLLSNYGLPVPAPAPPLYPMQTGSDTLPAETFLHAYTQASHCDEGVLDRQCYADLSLSTAAQLSATFPVVSSGTRLPKRYAAHASHFLDGGYFDNDGTASVIEFLKSALLDRCTAQGAPDRTTQVSAAAGAPCDASPPVHAPLRILLVEIRDGNDLNPEENQDDWNHQTGRVRETGTNGPQPWTSNTQLLAPLLGMWNAGHVSVTRRNRRELCLLEKAWGSDRLQLHHVVLGIPAQPVTGHADRYNTPPLSWKLTAAQKAYIERWAVQGEPTAASIGNAIDWVRGRLKSGAVTAEDSQEECAVLDQSYMRR